MTVRPRQAAGVAVLSAVVVVAVASRSGQSFYSDPALQMKTALQFVAGESLRPNAWVHPDHADLSRNTEENLIVWAPGTAIAFVPLVRAGLTPAHAARAVAALALLLGSAGWLFWFASFNLPRPIVFAYALVLPWMRFASNGLFLYTPEILPFAIVPWILVAALAVERAPRNTVVGAAAVGLAAGSLYIVKYSATFVTAGVLVWFAWRVAKKPTAKEAGPLWWQLTAAVVGAAVPIVLLSRWNQQYGGSPNLLSASFGIGWRWEYLVHAFALPSLAAADLDSLSMYVLMHPTHGLTANPFYLSLVGLPGAVLLVFLVARARVANAPADLARAVLTVSVAAILLVWTLSSAVSVEARHLASAGLAVLPLAIAEGREWWREAPRRMRRVMAAVACAFVLAPLSYGVLSVFVKTWRYPASYRAARSGIYNPLLSQQNAASVVNALARDFAPSTDVWYLVEPLTALDLPGRAVVRHADFIDVALLRRERFFTSRQLRVHVLLPPRFEQNGKGEAIRASFPQARAWARREIADAEYVSWTATLEPARGE
jgi:hypothetical protein